MNKKNSIIKHGLTQIVVKKTQNLMDITNSLVKNSKRKLVKKENTEIMTIDENFIQIEAGSFMIGS